MILKLTSFIAAVSFFSTALHAVGPNDKDLVVARHLAAKSSQHVYNDFVKNKAPGIQPYPYHVTLGWVENVAPQDYVPLQVRFVNVINKYNNVTFTPSAVKKYTVNRLLSRSPLVLTPKVNEEQTFKKINLALYTELQSFNKSNGKKYSFHQDVAPALYTPHITLVKSMDIQKNNLNRDHLIGLINPVVVAQPIELLQNPPITKTAKPSRTTKPSKTLKPSRTVKPSRTAKPSRTVKPYKKTKSSKKAKVQKKIKSVKKVRTPKVKIKTKKRPAMKRGKPFKKMKTPKKVNVKKRTHKKHRK